jgi:hypothetical protein
MSWQGSRDLGQFGPSYGMPLYETPHRSGRIAMQATELSLRFLSLGQAPAALLVILQGCPLQFPP